MDEDLLPWGWHPDEIVRLARRAAHKQFNRFIDYEECCDIASLAIIERLYLGDSEPSMGDLFNVAERAITTSYRHRAGEYGVPIGGTATGHRYAVWWHAERRTGVPFEERLAEHIALRQVFPVLSAGHREVLAAVARHWGDRSAAAGELGITRMALMIRLSKARAEFRWYWFWPEHAPRHWGRDHGILTTHDSSGENRAIRAIKRRRRAAAA